jgi:hypothetical protein
MFIFVDDKGFVMDFDKSGPELKYTQRPADAESFDTMSQVQCTIKVNGIDVDKISILRYT